MRLSFGLLLGFCLLSPINTSRAQEPRDWTLSGSELLYKLSANDEARSKYQFADSRTLNSEAHGYIKAIMDTQDGCLKGKILPHEVYDLVLTKLSALDAQALEANASVLIKDALQSRCKQ